MPRSIRALARTAVFENRYYVSCAFGALVLAAVLAAKAYAEGPGIESVDHAFGRWMREFGGTSATLSVAHGDRLVFVKGYGGLSGERRVLIASLTKPITGVCAALLIQQGKLRFESTLGEWLPRRYGNPRDPRLLAVTVAQLLTHRAGFSRHEDDPATGLALQEVIRRSGPRHASMHDLVPSVLRAKLDYDPGTTYAYTNAGHLLLGVLIEIVTGQSYEEACGSAVLAPQGVRRATLDPEWAVLGSFGGWSLSGPEYLAFLRAFAPTAPVLTRETRQWMFSAAGKETTANGPAFYSLLLVRPAAAGGYDLSHMGSFTYRFPEKRLEVKLNTLAVSAAFGASWFVYLEPGVSPTARLALDRELYQAVQGVNTWPEINLYPSFKLE
jgi:CubicO group peptidase (beta-lactamase class C family)